MCIVITLFVVWICEAFTPFVTTAYAAFVLELFSSPVSIVPIVSISLKILVVVSIVVVSSSIIISGFTISVLTGE